MDNAGSDGAIFFNIIGCCNFTEVKSCEMCTVLLDKGLFLTNWTTFATKHFVWLSSMLKTVNLEFCLLLSAARLARFWFKSLQRLTVYAQLLIQGNLSVLIVKNTCSVFCSYSLVLGNCFAVSKSELLTAPHYVSRNLNKKMFWGWGHSPFHSL